MKKTTKIIILLFTFLITVMMILFALFQIYQNSKTDGLNSGHIKISSCKELDWARKVYLCNGDYRSSAGMNFTNDVKVRVMGREYQKGEIVWDVYSGNSKSQEDARYFITGIERSSVMHNSLWIGLLALGIFIPSGILLYLIGFHFGSTKKK